MAETNILLKPEECAMSLVDFHAGLGDPVWNQYVVIQQRRT
jgi:hypothetical protein